MQGHMEEDGEGVAPWGCKLLGEYVCGCACGPQGALRYFLFILSFLALQY